MANVQESQVVEVLKQIKDPEKNIDIVSLHMVHNIQFFGTEIDFTLQISSSINSQKDELAFACQEAIQAAFPEITSVNIHFEVVAQNNRAKASVLPDVKNVIAVTSGKGGVGKSTVSTNLAVALSQMGCKVGIVDADIYGPSLPTMFGMQGVRPQIVEIDGQQKMIPPERNGIKVFSIGFVTDERQAVVWRGPMVTSTLTQFFTDTHWGELDYLILDLPPGTGDVQITLAQTVDLTGAILVTTPQKVSYVDARKAAGMFKLPNVNVPLLGVVENMAWFTPAELPENKYYIFGQGGADSLADEFEIPVLARIPLMQSVCKTADMGIPIAFEDTIESSYYVNLANATAKRIQEMTAKV